MGVLHLMQVTLTKQEEHPVFWNFESGSPKLIRSNLVCGRCITAECINTAECMVLMIAWCILQYELYMLPESNESLCSNWHYKQMQCLHVHCTAVYNWRYKWMWCFQNSMIHVCWMETFGQMVQLGGRMSANSAVVSMVSASVMRSHRSALNCQSLAVWPRFHKESAVQYVLVSLILEMKCLVYTNTCYASFECLH